MNSFNIQTQRCIITPADIHDLQDFILLQENPQTRKFLWWVIEAHQAKQKFIWILEDATKNIWSVRLHSSDFIWYIYLNPYCDESNLLEISYEFLPQFWGKWFAFECLSKFIEEYHKNMNINTFVAETQKKNIASCKLLEKLWFEMKKEIVRHGERQYVYQKAL